MSENNNVATKMAQPQAQLTDALEAWQAEACPAGQLEMQLVRLDASERLLIPFTTSMQRVELHYVEYPAVRSYVHCLGDGCLLCRLGRQREIRDLLPVIDPIARTVGLLAVSPSLRPHALRPQLTPVLQQVRGDQRVLVAVRQFDRGRFSVSTYPLPDGADDGANEVLDFQVRLEERTVDLRGVYQRLSNEDLLALPEITSEMRLRGLQAR